MLDARQAASICEAKQLKLDTEAAKDALERIIARVQETVDAEYDKEVKRVLFNVIPKGMTRGARLLTVDQLEKLGYKYIHPDTFHQSSGSDELRW